MLLRIDQETKTVVMQMLKYEFSISSNYKYRKKKKWEGQKRSNPSTEKILIYRSCISIALLKKPKSTSLTICEGRSFHSLINDEKKLY